MRRLIPALILSLTVLAFAAPPASAGAVKVPTTCVSLPDLKLPNVCDLKAGTLKLAADLGVQIGVSLQAVVKLGAQLSVLVNGSVDAGVRLVLNLPPVVVKLLCL